MTGALNLPPSSSRIALAETTRPSASLGALSPLVLERMSQWSREVGPGAVTAMDRRLVHKTQVSNVLLARVERLDPQDGNTHLARMLVDANHAFFFEHAIDHIPGLMFVEAARQLAVAVAHLDFHVPFGSPFVLNDLSARFVSFAELDSPTFILSTVADVKLKRDRLVEMSTAATFVQDETVLGVITGRATVLPPIGPAR